MEAFLWALQKKERELVERMVEWGRALEGSESGRFDEVFHFYDSLSEEGGIDQYFEKAEQYMTPDRVLFTGYLPHGLLCHLFPCCDLAIFPSLIPEGGPLVLLEAIASGSFPIGTYQAGMAANIDRVAAALPPEDAKWMKLTTDPAELVADIAAKVVGALPRATQHKTSLHDVAVQRFDWQSVAEKLASEFHALTS